MAVRILDKLAMSVDAWHGLDEAVRLQNTTPLEVEMAFYYIYTDSIRASRTISFIFGNVMDGANAGDRKYASAGQNSHDLGATIGAINRGWKQNISARK